MMNVSDSSGLFCVMAQVEASYSYNPAAKDPGLTSPSPCWYESSLSAPEGVMDGLDNLCSHDCCFGPKKVEWRGLTVFMKTLVMVTDLFRTQQLVG